MGDNVEDGCIVLAADADLTLLQKGVDALAAQAASRAEAAERKRKEDEQKAKAAKKAREDKQKQAEEAGKFDAAVASISAANGNMAEEEDAQLEAIEAFMDANPDLKAGQVFDSYEIERQVAAAAGNVMVQFVASAGTSYHEYNAFMKRSDAGEWSVSKVDKS